MKKLSIIGIFIIIGASMNGCNDGKGSTWRETLANRLSLYGHRNWIVVADAAYPSQSRAGIETVVTHEEQLTVVAEVLKALGSTKHVRANVYLDKELTAVPETDAPGVEAYRIRLNQMLEGRIAGSPLHEDLISKLDDAGKTFNVLILKTTLTIPYTSVFFELGCGYWDDASESKLRSSLKGE